MKDHYRGYLYTQPDRKMRAAPHREVYFGQWVWVNPTTESLRDKECLCNNCANLKVKPRETNCPVADSLYELCVKNNVAMAITRCPIWKPLP